MKKRRSFHFRKLTSFVRLKIPFFGMIIATTMNITGNNENTKGNDSRPFAHRGQGLLELAFALPLFLVVVFGVFDLGRVYFSTIALVNAAREGVRYLTVYPDDVSNDLGQFFTTEQRTIQEAAAGGVTISTADVTVSCTNGDEDNTTCDSGGTAVVSVSHDFDLILGWLLPSPISLTRSAEMIVP
jgi:hypothetical protein